MQKDTEFSLRLTLEMKQKLVAISETRGESISVIVREALRAYFARLEKGDCVDCPARRYGLNLSVSRRGRGAASRSREHG